MARDWRDGQSPYQGTTGKAEERRSVVVVADILGFRRLLMAAAAAKRTAAELTRFRTAVDEAYEFLDPRNPFEDEGKRLWDLKMFTDNLVMGHVIETAGLDAETELGLALFAIAGYQCSMARHGYFLRGGLAIGDLYMDRDIVWGEGLVNAHEFDRSGAPPRLALGPATAEEGDRTLLAHVLLHLAYYGAPSEAPHNRHLLFDASDECVFVDYLSFLFDPDGQGDPPDTVSLDRHKRHLEHNLRDASDAGVRAKYEWLAAYHNFCVGEERLSHSLTIDGSGFSLPHARFRRFGSLFKSRSALISALPWIESRLPK